MHFSKYAGFSHMKIVIKRGLIGGRGELAGFVPQFNISSCEGRPIAFGDLKFNHRGNVNGVGFLACSEGALKGDIS